MLQQKARISEQSFNQLKDELRSEQREMMNLKEEFYQMRLDQNRSNQINDSKIDSIYTMLASQQSQIEKLKEAVEVRDKILPVPKDGGFHHSSPLRQMNSPTTTIHYDLNKTGSQARLRDLGQHDARSPHDRAKK